MSLEAGLKSACDAVEVRLHASGAPTLAPRHYLSLPALPHAEAPRARPGLSRRPTGLNELRGALSDQLEALEADTERARDRAEAGVLRWGVHLAWWWLRRRLTRRR